MKNSKSPRLQQGLTLIEILVAAMIFTIVIVGASAIFGQAGGAKAKIEASKKTQEAGRVIMERLVREIKTANGQSRDAVGNQIYNFAILNASGIRNLNPLANPNHCSTLDPGTNRYCGLKIVHLGEDGITNTTVLYFTGDGNISFRENANPFENLNPGDVQITGLTLTGYYRTTEPAETQQPFITISLTLRNTQASGRFSDTFTLQTTVTMDNLAR